MIGVNCQAAWRLIRSCGPLLAIAAAGRAVFVGSRVARHPRAYLGAYGATKAGLEHLVLGWAAETTEQPLRVNLFDPGPVASRLRREGFPGEDASTLPQPRDVAMKLADLCMASETRHGSWFG